MQGALRPAAVTHQRLIAADFVFLLSAHGQAFFHAFPTSIDAFLTVIDLMFGTFLSTCSAYFRTVLANKVTKFAAADHVVHCQAAECSAICIERDTALQHSRIRFTFTGGCAIFAEDGAGFSSINTILILCV